MPGQNFALRLRQNTFFPHGLFIPHHDRKRLGGPVLSLPQPVDRLRVIRPAAQMKAADALDRRDPALREDAPHRPDRIPPALRSSDEINLRAACIAAHRLRVIAPRGRRLIFLPAGTAHRKHLHRRALPVIGKTFENRQPRAARCTVDERMQIAAVVRIKQLPPAVVAERDIRWNENLSLLPGALHDRKTRADRRVRYLLAINFQNHGARRRLLLKETQKGRNLPLLSLRRHLDKRALIAYRAGDPAPFRQPHRRRAEPDSLHNSVYPNPLCDQSSSSP